MKKPNGWCQLRIYFLNPIFLKKYRMVEEGCQLEMTSIELANPLETLEGSSSSILIITYPPCQLTYFLYLKTFCGWIISFFAISISYISRTTPLWVFQVIHNFDLTHWEWPTHLTLDLRRQSTRTVRWYYWGSWRC